MTPDEIVDEWGRESFPASDATTSWAGPEEAPGDTERLTEVVDGREAEIVFHRSGDRLVLTHTEVPSAIAGRGIGGALVARVVELAIAEHRTLVPVCPFARHWLGEHHDVRDRVTIDWHLPA